MKTILITGSTGFLGKHLVEQLLEAEPEARLRLMRRAEGPAIDSERVEVIAGDILEREDVKRAVAGVDEIYHLAGAVEREPRDPWRMFNVHVEGTRNVCEAMLENPISRAVFASTSGVCAVGPEPAELDETAPYAQDVVWDWPYYTSKIYAEKMALWYVEHRKLHIVHVNPSLILGPGDDRRSSTRDVEMFLDGQIKVIPLGGLNLVDVRDAARGCILAMQKGAAGERYLLGGANMTFYEWIRRTANLSGARAPKVMAPLQLSRWGARALRKVLPWFGKRFDLDDSSIRMSAVYWYCNSQKARTELGFTTRDPDVTLRDTIEYLRASART